MPSAEIARLWKLAQIDHQIADVRNRAATLDVGQREQAALNGLAGEIEVVGGKAKKLQQEITDLEIAQKSDADKRMKIESEIYGGKVINPREVANLEKEIAIIQKKRDSDAEKLLELYEEAPPSLTAWDELKVKVDALNEAMAKKRATASVQKKQIEDAFHQLAAKRPEAAKAVPPNLLARYETIKKNHGSGMVELDRKTGNCGGCGTHQPERTIQMLREDKLAQCESCHRILYYTEGAV
jgi:predicted  nucleic acid-binding Zn-ribbon protein